jgi:zeaxanthin epoxidase
MKEDTVKNSMGIKSYVEHEDGTVDIFTDDGEEIKGFDILIGADGIWSSIRAQMWGEDSVRPGTATYSGYTLFAAETIMPPDSEFFKQEGYFDTGYKVYIGPGKYFVTSDVGSGRIQWYAFLGLPPGTKARSSNVDFVKEEFKGWSPEIIACLDNTPEEITEQRDLYDRRPSVFKSWSKGHVTMLGDAVHPMMPNLGQGGCQAIEDAYVLCDVLCDVTDKSQIKGKLQDYYQERLWRSAVVQGFSRFSSDIIINGFSTPFRFSEFIKEGLSYKYLNFQSLLTWYLQSLLPIVFYAQFGFLYSFQPSSFDKAQIDSLVDNSNKRNKEEAEKVYKTLADGFVTYFTAKSMSFMKFNKQTSEITKVSVCQVCMYCTMTYTCIFRLQMQRK